MHSGPGLVWPDPQQALVPGLPAVLLGASQCQEISVQAPELSCSLLGELATGPLQGEPGWTHGDP